MPDSASAPPARAGAREPAGGPPSVWAILHRRCGDNEQTLALAEALRWALVRAAERTTSGRVIVAIDELQRVDTPSRHAFADVANETPDGAAAMVAEVVTALPLPPLRQR